MKLVLGTVQFGLCYGINNQKGKPSRESSLKMLKRAYDLGINIFDTANAYGDAESILGEFVEKYDLKNKIKIISKLKPNIIDDTKEVKDVIIKQLKNSLNLLQLDKLDGYLLHTPSYIYNDDIIKALDYCKNEGLTENIGVSIYDMEDAIYAAKTKKIDYIQIPYSVFDQRVNKTDFFKIARDNNVVVYGRSAFLQGLFFMPNNKIPPHLKDAKIYLSQFDEIIYKYRLSRLEATLLFSYCNPFIDYLVFGVDDIYQLQQDVDIALSNTDISDCVTELKGKMSVMQRSIIFPSLWTKQ